VELPVVIIWTTLLLLLDMDSTRIRILSSSRTHGDPSGVLMVMFTLAPMERLMVAMVSVVSWLPQFTLLLEKYLLIIDVYDL